VPCPRHKALINVLAVWLRNGCCSATQSPLTALTHDEARGAGSNIFPVYRNRMEIEIDIFVAKREDVLRKIILDRQILLAAEAVTVAPAALG
jgi:hypothetical protein